MNLSSIVSLYPHQTAQAQHQHSSLCTVKTPLLACRRQCQRRHFSVAPNFHAERSSPRTAGNLNISNYSILITFKLHSRTIWQFTAGPDALNLLSVVNSTITKIQSKTWTRFSTSNTSKISQPQNLNHCHLLCRGRTHTPAAVLCWINKLLSHRNMTLNVALWRSYTKIPNTQLRRMKSTTLSIVRSRRMEWRRTMTTCWRKKTRLYISQASKTGMACKSSWLACQMIWLLGSGTYTLSRISNGMTITNILSNIGVDSSSKALDGWSSSQRTRSISFTPLTVSLTAIPHQNSSLPKCTLRAGGGRHR